MTAQSPEEAYNRLAGLWSLVEFRVGHEYTLSDWIGLEYDVASPTARDIYDRFDSLCNLNATLDEFVTFVGFKFRPWPLSPRFDRDLTLGQFSVWLLDHCDLPDVQPLNIAGKLCEPGGIFLGMSEIVQRETGNDRVRPSTRVADVLKFDQLLVVLWQIQVATGRVLPPKESAMSPGCAAFLSTVFGAAAIIVGIQWPRNLLVLTGIGSMLTGIIVAVFYQQATVDTILPAGVTTFGDLAKAFAANEQISTGDAT